MIQTGMDALRVQNSRQQTGHHGLSCGARHAHKCNFAHRSRQRGAQLFGGGKAVRQGSEILICLFDGHGLLLITMMKQQPAQRHKNKRCEDACQNACGVQPHIGDLTAAPL